MDGRLTRWIPTRCMVVPNWDTPIIQSSKSKRVGFHPWMEPHVETAANAKYLKKSSTWSSELLRYPLGRLVIDYRLHANYILASIVPGLAAT